jgi:hypothetical protein
VKGERFGERGEFRCLEECPQARQPFLGLFSTRGSNMSTNRAKSRVNVIHLNFVSYLRRSCLYTKAPHNVEYRIKYI